MTSPLGGTNNQALANQEAQNAAALEQMAQNERQAAAQLNATATTGQAAGAMQNLAQQEAQNQQILQQMAQREGQAANQLGTGAAGTTQGGV
ncbi:MAG TPA: hypothetical protein VD973_11540 [Symbiobacteriaceae bacterium]|jgi:hypothetical protein|nr:hypothetical protein [Symbiobacteriaceae bacterium]